MKAIWTLLALASLLGLFGCLEEENEGPSQEDYEYLQEDVRVLKEDLEKAYLELDDYDAKFEVFEELEEKAKSAEERAVELEELKKEKEKVEEEMRNLRKEFDDYQKKYEAKVRQAGEGQEFATLELEDRTLNEVVINSVTETAVKIRHADGFATLNSSTAPAEWTKRFFLRSEEEIAEREAQLAAFLNPSPEVEEDPAQSNGRPLSDYQKRRLAREAEEEALKSLGPKVENALLLVSGKNRTGSGFFVQDGITTYFYTAAKLLDQNPGLQITDKNGREWKKFGEFEVSLQHDMVRMAVTEAVENPLPLRPISQGLEAGSNLAGFSLVKGSSQPSQSKLQLRGTKDDLYDVSSGDLQSLVGGPVLNSEGAVVGMVTNPLVVRRDIFDEKEKSYGRVRPIVCRLDWEQKWEKSSLSRFVAAGNHLAAFDQGSLYLYALSQLKPSNTGVNLDGRIQGGESVRSIVGAKDPQVLAQLTRINETLSGGRKLSQRDINKKFRLVFQGAVNSAQSEALDQQSFSPFHRPDVEISSKFRRKAFSDLKRTLEAVR